MARRIWQTLDEHLEWIEGMALVSTVMLTILRHNRRGMEDLVRVEAPGHPDDGLEIEILWPDDATLATRTH